MVEIEIDGQKVEATEGSMLIEAARLAGAYIPHFCYHKKLSVAANCRMCLVEVEKAPKPLPACATPVTSGMKVQTHSEKAVKAQQSVMEFLLINHPLDCPICDQGGECQLQDIAVGYGGVKSRYTEEKRVVFHKNVGPLISMEEMSRCIHCTRCVRFGQEIAGVMELGMLGRGEHSEITTFVGNTVDSELSGNMIDICPVGALTSKPFRYSARTWELSRKKSVSPHDSLGANIVVQAKNQRVMRVVPLENESVNECWISDRDRFAYEGLNSEDRLTKPMIKQGGEWREVDWQTALEYVAHGLQNIQREHGFHAIGALATPYSTVEELYLLQKLVRDLGSDAVDCRLRQVDHSNQLQGTPWLGMPIAAIDSLHSVLIVGSTLRKDHPVLSARLRQSAKHGTQVYALQAADDDLLMSLAGKTVAPPSAWVGELACIAAAVARQCGVIAPAIASGIEPTDAACKVATVLLSGDNRAIFLGNAVSHHPQFAHLHALAQWIADTCRAKLGFLTEGANTVGAHLVNACGHTDVLSQQRKAYLLMHVEPELDSGRVAQFSAALKEAEMVVVLSPFRHAQEYADVLLPIAPFTETSGTFVNCEGRVQSFNGAVRPLGETRPGWKVLRVLGNLLGLPGFEFETSESVRDLALQGEINLKLNNATDSPLPSAVPPAPTGIECISEVPIYSSDAIVRRSSSLQLTADAKRARQIAIATGLFAQLGLQAGEEVCISQQGSSVVLPVVNDARLPENSVRIATNLLKAPGFGVIELTRAPASTTGQALGGAQ